MTVDGKITTRAFSPVDFTSREDKLHLLCQRALGDAVLIGRSTLAHDNIRLGLPDPKMRAEREARGQSPYPLRVIVSNQGRIDPALKIFETATSRIVVFSTTRMPRKFQLGVAREGDAHPADGPSVNRAHVATTSQRVWRPPGRPQGGAGLPQSARITAGRSTQPHDRALHLRRERRAYSDRPRPRFSAIKRALFVSSNANG
jgi:hypothetical protein